MKWFRKTPQLCITSFGTTYLYSEKTLINEYDWTNYIYFDLRSLYLNSRKIFTWGVLFNQNYCEAIVPAKWWMNKSDSFLRYKRQDERQNDNMERERWAGAIVVFWCPLYGWQLINSGCATNEIWLPYPISEVSSL